MKRIVILPLLALSLVSCSSLQNGVERNLINFTNHPAHIQCYSGGTLVLDTISEGKVTDDAHSDGFFFKDSKTGKFVEVNLDCVFSYDDSNARVMPR